MVLTKVTARYTGCRGDDVDGDGVDGDGVCRACLCCVYAMYVSQDCCVRRAVAYEEIPRGNCVVLLVVVVVAVAVGRLWEDDLLQLQVRNMLEMALL